MDIIILGCVIFVMDRPGIGHGRREGIVLEEIQLSPKVYVIARLPHETQNINSLSVIYVFHVDVIPAFPPKWQPPDRETGRARAGFRECT